MGSISGIRGAFMVLQIVVRMIPGLIAPVAETAAEGAEVADVVATATATAPTTFETVTTGVEAVSSELQLADQAKTIVEDITHHGPPPPRVPTDQAPGRPGDPGENPTQGDIDTLGDRLKTDEEEALDARNDALDELADAQRELEEAQARGWELLKDPATDQAEFLENYNDILAAQEKVAAAAENLKIRGMDVDPEGDVGTELGEAAADDIEQAQLAQDLAGGEAVADDQAVPDGEAVPDEEAVEDEGAVDGEGEDEEEEEDEGEEEAEDEESAEGDDVDVED